MKEENEICEIAVCRVGSMKIPDAYQEEKTLVKTEDIPKIIEELKKDRELANYLSY